MVRIKRSLASAVGAVLVLGLAPGLAGSAPAAPASRPTQADPGPGQPGFIPGPVHAGTEFKWGRPAFRDEWEPDVEQPRPIESFWKVRGPGLVRVQHGMMTLNTTQQGTVSATLQKPGHSYGRWEMRLRSRRNYTRNTDFWVITSLIPSGGRAYHCGANNIDLETYAPDGAAARFNIRALPQRQFSAARLMDLGTDVWHTFAVEVTPTRISWFVDAQVVNSETRSASRSGVPLTVRFTMQASGSQAMNQSRMQMDWLRYWTLKRPNAKSTAAPATQFSQFAGAC